MPRTAKKVAKLSPGDLKNIVETHLPAWLKACGAEADAIVLHEKAFGTSKRELFLFACAIKYAAHKGKTVHVTSKREEEASRSHLNAADAIYRESPVRRRSTGIPIE